MTCWDCLHFDGMYCVIYYRRGEWDEILKNKIRNPERETECEDFEEVEDD